MGPKVHSHPPHFLFGVSLQHCTLDLGSYIKDLSVVHNDMSSIVILDNSPGAYRSHPGTFESIADWIRGVRPFLGRFLYFKIVTSFRAEISSGHQFSLVADDSDGKPLKVSIMGFVFTHFTGILTALSAK